MTPINNPPRVSVGIGNAETVDSQNPDSVIPYYRTSKTIPGPIFGTRRCSRA